MAQWQVTHGRARGGYLSVAGVELYVRQVLGEGNMPTGQWQLFVDGKLEGTATGEDVARSAAELTIRAMVEAEAAGVAAATGQGGRAA